MDKYAPKSFSQLLSYEKTNREVLRAVKMWDKHVFNKEPPPPPVVPSYYGSNVSGTGGTGGAKKEGVKAVTPDSLDDEESLYNQSDKRDKRPFHKVTSLSMSSRSHFIRTLFSCR